jgi:hypothetical protein
MTSIRSSGRERYFLFLSFNLLIMGEFSFHTKLMLYIQLAIAISIEWTISTIGIFAIFIPTMHLLPVEIVYAKLNTRNVISVNYI